MLLVRYKVGVAVLVNSTFHTEMVDVVIAGMDTVVTVVAVT